MSVGPAPPEVAREPFDPSWYPALAEAEDRHFWFVARSELIAGVVKQLTSGLDAVPRVLEVGCGTGGVLRALAAAHPGIRLVGLDYLSEGLSIASERSGAMAVRGQAMALPFAPAFDVVCLLDVIEHIADDISALVEARTILRPGGHVVLTVPAFPRLWSEIDELSGHQRRYSRRELDKSIRAGGFVPLRSTYFMAALSLPAFVLRRTGQLLARRTPNERSMRELQHHSLVNSVALRVLRRENRRIFRGRSLPFGLSLLAVARTGSVMTEP